MLLLQQGETTGRHLASNQAKHNTVQPQTHFTDIVKAIRQLSLAVSCNLYGACGLYAVVYAVVLGVCL